MPLTFTVGVPHPVGAVGVHDTHHILSHQLVLGRALQGDDRAHGRAVPLDDPLGAQGRQGPEGALSLGATCERDRFKDSKAAQQASGVNGGKHRGEWSCADGTGTRIGFLQRHRIRI